jgi:hypothetical protein
VDLAASGRGAFCDDSGFSTGLVGIFSLETKRRVLHPHYNISAWGIAKRRGTFCEMFRHEHNFVLAQTRCV